MPFKTLKNPSGWPAQRLASVFNRLDVRAASGLVVLAAGDSTSDAATEFLERSWSDVLALVWPDRAARVTRWNPGLLVYNNWETWQTGNNPIYRDDFSVDGATIIGNTALNPDVGSPYTEFSDDSAAFSVSGGKLTRGGTLDGVRRTLRATWNGRSTPDFVFTGKVFVPTEATTNVAEVFVASTNETVWRIGIEIVSSGAATLKKYDGTTVTTLGTFSGGTYVGVEVSFSMSLLGTAFSATLAGSSLTATLSSDELTSIGTLTKTVVRSQIPATTWDDFNVISQTPASPPRVDVYNGSAAGQTAEYQRTNINVFSPVAPDLLLINHGHNYLVEVTVQQFLDSISGLVADVNAKWGIDVPVVVTSQNPRFGSLANTYHVERMMALRDLAVTKGWGYIPSYEMFAKRADGGYGLMYTGSTYDEIHPGLDIAPGETESGRTAYTRVASDWLKAHTERPLV